MIIGSVSLTWSTCTGVRFGGASVGCDVLVGGMVIMPSMIARENMLKTNNPDSTAAMIPMIPLRMVLIGFVKPHSGCWHVKASEPRLWFFRIQFRARFFPHGLRPAF